MYFSLGRLARVGITREGLWLITRKWGAFAGWNGITAKRFDSVVG